MWLIPCISYAGKWKHSEKHICTQRWHGCEIQLISRVTCYQKRQFPVSSYLPPDHYALLLYVQVVREKTGITLIRLGWYYSQISSPPHSYLLRHIFKHTFSSSFSNFILKYCNRIYGKLNRPTLWWFRMAAVIHCFLGHSLTPQQCNWVKHTGKYIIRLSPNGAWDICFILTCSMFYFKMADIQLRWGMPPIM